MTTRVLIAAACAAALSAVSADAAIFDFTYHGYFGTDDALNPAGAPTENFAAPTAFTLMARFSDQDNLAPGFFPGFVGYAPITATIDIGGTIYDVASFTDDPIGGIAVVLFDETNIFFPGFYAAGFINDPAADGAGIVGDFITTSPDLDADSLGATTFSDYRGAGYLSGICENPGGMPPCATTPLSLFALDGTAYSLTLFGRIEEVADTGLVHSATLAPVPLPATLPLLGTAILAAAGASRRRRT